MNNTFIFHDGIIFNYEKDLYEKLHRLFRMKINASEPVCVTFSILTYSGIRQVLEAVEVHHTTHKIYDENNAEYNAIWGETWHFEFDENDVLENIVSNYTVVDTPKKLVELRKLEFSN